VRYAWAGVILSQNSCHKKKQAQKVGRKAVNKCCYLSAEGNMWTHSAYLTWQAVMETAPQHVGSSKNCLILLMTDPES